MLKVRLGSIVLLTAMVVGCGEPTPLQKLQSNVIHEEMQHDFWGKEQDKNTPLWQEAVNYCDQHANKPNCAVISNLQIFAAGNQELKPYGSSGYDLKLYDFKDPN